MHRFHGEFLISPLTEFMKFLSVSSYTLQWANLPVNIWDLFHHFCDINAIIGSNQVINTDSTWLLQPESAAAPVASQSQRSTCRQTFHLNALSLAKPSLPTMFIRLVFILFSGKLWFGLQWSTSVQKQTILREVWRQLG